MGRGNLTEDEIRRLSKNPYVANVNRNRITYTEDFKLLFLKEYYSGKKPTRIFKEAGFDVSILGSKRIERCCARWREANAAGSLGDKYAGNDFYDSFKTDNEVMMLERIIKHQVEEIESLKEYIKRLEKAAEA